MKRCGSTVILYFPRGVPGVSGTLLGVLLVQHFWPEKAGASKALTGNASRADGKKLADFQTAIR